MLEALRRNSSRSQTVKSKTILAPTKGLVALNNIAAGVPGTALKLKNFFPKADTVELRGGWEEHSDSGVSYPVESLMTYHGATQNKMFGGINNAVYDMTSSTGSITSITGLSNVQIESVNFSTSGGHFLYCVNGEDDAFYFDGASWTVPVITGVSSDSFTHVNVFKSRLYFVVKDSLEFAFLPVDSIAGVADTFPLGNVFSKGGKLVATATYTGDGGAGPDDHFVAITSQGQAAIYAGSDPADPNAWNHIGTFDLARPLGNRCCVKVGGDLYINTELGVVPLSQALKVDAAALGTVAVTTNISPLINRDAQRYKANFGWQMIAVPKHAMAIINVPVSESKSHRQYVMNSQTGAWCEFEGINAVCWAALDGMAYFGGIDGKVYEAFESASDGGSDIAGDMLTAYDDFGAKSRIKNWKMIRPVIYAQASVSPQIGLNVDYVEAIPSGSIESATTSASLWGHMTWGSFTWFGGLSLSAKWKPITDRVGYVGAVRMRVFASGSGSPVLLQVNQFDVTYEVGGVM